MTGFKSFTSSYTTSEPWYRRVGSMPVIRLENGNHVEPKVNGQVQAYLPAKTETGFPTVARSVCDSHLSRQFLRSLGLSEPDAVDDVLLNLIPKYTPKPAEIDDGEYAADVRRILNAFETSAGDQRLKLIRALSATSFVRLIDAGESSNKMWGSPSRAYLPSEELSDLFDGIKGVLFVDRTYKCLCGDRVEELLKACGSASVLRAEEFKNESRFTQGERIKMRIMGQGHNGSTRAESVNDWRIRGLQQLLNSLPTLDQEVRSRKAKLLWRSLAEVNSSRLLRQVSLVLSYEPISKSSIRNSSRSSTRLPGCQLQTAVLRNPLRLSLKTWTGTRMLPSIEGAIQALDDQGACTGGWLPTRTAGPAQE